MRTFAIAMATACFSLFYRLCRIFPAQRRIVCISRQSDSPPADFVLIRAALAREEPPCDVVILANQLQKPLPYLLVMARQIFYIATSQAVVLDSYCIVVSLLGSRIKAPVIQIWHALGNMKKFGYAALDTPEGHSSEMARLMHMHEGYDAVAVSSLSFREDFAAGFGVDPTIIFEAPLPRTDLLLSPAYRSAQRAAFLEAHPEALGRKTIVYCPTFRKTAPSNQETAMAQLIETIDFDHYNLVFMPHPVSSQTIDDKRVITFPKGEVDPLFAADYVISDYSTVIYEAGVLGVPVFLYAYDWDTYSEKRAFNIDLEHSVPTVFAKDPTIIMKCIEEGRFDAEAYGAFVKENIAFPLESSCTRQLCDKILEYMA